MDSGFDNLLSVVPWLLIAFSALQLYRSARTYVRTQRITPQLLGFFFLGIAFGCMGVAQLRNWIPRGLRIALDLTGVVFALLSIGVLIVYEKPWAPKPKA